MMTSFRTRARSKSRATGAGPASTASPPPGCGVRATAHGGHAAQTAVCAWLGARKTMPLVNGPRVAPALPTMNRSRSRLRVWGAAAGVVVSLVDAAILSWLGTTFTLNGHDAWWLVALWFSGTGALLGFLLGDAIDTRRRERATADALAAARAHVAQTEK